MPVQDTGGDGAAALPDDDHDGDVQAPAVTGRLLTEKARVYIDMGGMPADIDQVCLNATDSDRCPKILASSFAE